MMATMFDLNVKGGSPSTLPSPLKSSSTGGLDHSNELVNVIVAVKKSSAVPKCMKKAIEILASQMQSMLEAKDAVIEQLRDENAKIKERITLLESSVSKAFNSLPNATPTKMHADKPIIDDSNVVSEAERRRSIVVGRFLS
ncbi:unnamed protein product [Heligmosomoides polygyrus]|uniref:Ty3-gypsy retrotransposon protein n=1 Tax=Heligmosomoides polygyrus TaxID=6339 RepID=A0A183F313_HELPZ|nr:unnamed protein product [Heligmosomoides polygyrus]